MENKIKIHTKEAYEGMRSAGRLAAQVLNFIEPKINPGVSTLQINNECHNFIISHNAIPAPLNYKGFPKSVCTSVNHVVCHGIPSDDKILMDGDIVNVDVTIILNGWHGDTSKTFKVGPSFKKHSSKTIKANRLVNITHDAMWCGIEMVKPGAYLSDIGRAIQNLAESEGFSVVRDYCGHGIGRVFHDEPNVLHYVASKNSGFVDIQLETGMFFTIEPMVNVGGYATILSNDGWTVTTRDKSLSAQFEHTVGVTSNGYEVFTLSE